MKFSRTYFLFLFLLVGMMSWNTATAQCPDCTIFLPPMPVDTVYLDTFPNARQNEYYEEEISFRLPMTTTPLVALAPGTPSGISLTGFEVIGISGLPLGMNFKLDRPLPAMYDDVAPDTRDGCVTICGTPLQSDSFEIIISVLVHTGILAPQPASIPVTFVVLPDTSAGFTISGAVGCSPLTVSLTNNVVPDTAFGQTASYNWDFGNGQTSTDINPSPVTYSDTGTYNITYQAVVTTTIEQTFLTSVTINAVGCTDPFNAVDLFLTVTGSQTGIDTVTIYQENTAPPVTFNFGTDILLQAGTTYSLFVQDDDEIASGWPPPADCGTVVFSADTTANTFTLTNGALSLVVNLSRSTSYSYDTINTTDFVVSENCIAVEHLEAISRSFNVFPNPSSGQVQVQFNASDLQRDVQLRVTDVLGRIVVDKTIANQADMYSESYDFSQFGTGVYIVQLQLGDIQIYRKLIIK